LVLGTWCFVPFVCGLQLKLATANKVQKTKEQRTLQFTCKQRLWL